MAENKVVIKINYDKDKSLEPAAPKMVTVWHTRRILAAAAVLVFLVSLPVFWFSGSGDQSMDRGEPVEIANSEQSFNNVDPVIQQEKMAPNANHSGKETAGKISKNPDKDEVAAVTDHPAAIIYTKKVVRASLNTGPKDREPFQPVKLPVGLAQNQKIELFYFTELKNIREGALYHYWFKDGKPVEKKQLNVKDSGGKLISQRTLSFKDHGEWQIQLVDKKGKVYSEVNFSVYPE